MKLTHMQGFKTYTHSDKAASQMFRQHFNTFLMTEMIG